MADTFHPQMCLHPARHDEGELGKKMDYALLWNGDCPVQSGGRPAFHALLDLDLPVDEREKAGEYLREKIVEHLASHRDIKSDDLDNYVSGYKQARAIVE